MLKTEDYEKVIYFLSQIQDTNENFCNKVLESLEKVFNYQHSAFFITDKSITTPVASNLNKRVLEDYKTYFYKKDIFNSDHLNKLDIVAIKDIMPMKKYRNSEYYNDFLKEYNLSYTVAVPLKFNNHHIGGIGIHKPKESGDFTNKEMLILTNMAKFISSNLYKFLAFSQIKFQEMMLTNAIHHLPVGILMLDSKFSLLHYNSIAEEYCSKIVSSTYDKSMHNLFSHLLSKLDTRLFNDLNRKRKVELQSYIFEILPLQASTLLNNKTEKFYSIFIYPKSFKKVHSFKKAIVKYNLSKREIEIIDLLSKGYNNREIASHLYVSINTVKSHLNNIYNKLDVNNRTAVLHKINQVI